MKRRFGVWRTLLLMGLLAAGSLADGAWQEVSAEAISPAALAQLDELSREGQWLALLAAADEDMRRSPGAVEPVVYKMRALRMLGHLEPARSLAREKLKLFGERAEFWLEKAWVEVLAGDYQTGLADADRAAARRPDLADAVLLQGVIHREQENWRAADTAFARAEALRPNDSLVLLNRGRIAVEQGRWEAAIDLLSRSLALRAASAETSFHRGRAYAAKGDLAAASHDLTQAILQRPEVAAPYVARAEVLARAGMWARAADDADTALALGAQSLSAHLVTCRAAEALEAWPGLEPRAQAMIAAFPAEAQGYRFYSQALNNLGRTAAALQACDEAVRLAPDDDLLRLERATLQIAMQQYAAAVDDCTAVLRREPLALGYALRGLAWLRQHDLDRAEENAANALTLDSAVATAHLVLAEVQLARSQSTQALASARRALYLAPQLSWAQVVHGQALLAMGQTAEALEAASQTIAQSPESAQAYALRVRCYVALGQKQAARKDLAELVRLDPALGQQVRDEFLP
ncbi:tetratricopeptide repeat protein [Desulfuromonas sp. KJ2020]|uniref:tetratricopeptide repeat protein n=1 Tax=Desulfuromonas sp. KJ2020 TaxID=2919173 RepID=UPI0020A73911|nr:tetratricopeptide repeat protein [Desulfuromonas sp. KJ2020]MCP3176486.1 tetratricopeptide repeat protein [Desulfuromonas sp. KJ2020]